MERGSDFWRFSLSLYRMDGVPAACIALQDNHGLDVNVMLFALWLASKGRELSAGDLREVDEAIAAWRRDVVVALRGVRRHLRQPPEAVDALAAEALRDKVKAVELESERLQQEGLFALRAPEAWGSPAAPDTAGAANLDACAASMGATFSTQAKEALLSSYRLLIAMPKS